MKLILFPLILLASVSGFIPQKKVTREQAILLAEQYVLDNGFTEAPADRSKLKFDVVERFLGNVDTILKFRYNTLHPTAFCIGDNDESWDVGFLDSRVELDKLDSLQRQTDVPGRAVIVMKDGSEVYMAHKDPLFSYFEKL